MPSKSIHVAQSSIHVTSEQIMVSVFQRCANSSLLDPLPHLKKSHQLLCFHTLNNYLISLIFKSSLGWENLVWDCFILLESVKWKWSCSVVSNPLQPYGLQPARLLCPWDFPGNNTGVGCHFLLQGIFPTQGSNPGLLHCRQMLLPSEPPGKSLLESKEHQFQVKKKKKSHFLEWVVCKWIPFNIKTCHR